MLTRFVRFVLSAWKACETCKGSGQHNGKKCPACNGQGGINTGNV